ncbi:type IV secretion system DNA-binding domain-containing protein [Aliarcobacter cryaerophilus]|uniref:type IV secretory system conjugative DNA transfer family protein n=1 Tax=Aliarcobacter cryaerophilus TaxID=28198 RepID=UPI0021B5BCB7|nr:type IV secretion system DNA-binding domain-containing protein [Aliarcobacter cryaerophilus]MCT7466980.1 type IV secretion system DNA-binding domain-containing protein [Aliarcobacter cryaerophilus]
MGIFDIDTSNNSKAVEISSVYGKALTTVENAKADLYFKPHNFNPLDYINTKGKDFFYGLEHNKNEKIPFFLPPDEVTMQLLVGSTGTGKGVLLGNILAEKIGRKEGVIIIDPKKDAFLGQIAKELLTKQGRPQDLLVASFPQQMGYMGINEDDTYQEVANKLIDAFSLEETDNAGVNHYRKNERIMLKRVLKIFFDGELGIIVKKDLNEIANAIIQLSEDLKRKDIFEKESAKSKPNINLIQRNSKRYFDGNKLDLLNFNEEDLKVLKSLSISFDEFITSAKITNEINLDEALYNGKVVYLNLDMLDIASLKMAKICITDIIQKARKKLPTTKIWIIADEISFYATQTLAGALATTRGFNLNFILALQDLAQMKEEHIKKAIISNCNVKIFYKPSDKETLNYIQEIGGKEAITKVSKKENDMTITQDLEDTFNVTKIRALWRSGVAIIIAEFLPTPAIVQTNFIAVTQQFDWTPFDKAKEVKEDYSNMEIKFKSKQEREDTLMKYRQSVKGTGSLCEGLEGILFENEIL